jgi:hypothetical protein
LNITDHGELDFLTPPTELSEADKAIVDATRHAMAEQRYYLNTQDRVRQERARSRALYEQGNRDFPTHNRDDA